MIQERIWMQNQIFNPTKKVYTLSELGRRILSTETSRLQAQPNNV